MLTGCVNGVLVGCVIKHLEGVERACVIKQLEGVGRVCR